MNRNVYSLICRSIKLCFFFYVHTFSRVLFYAVLFAFQVAALPAGAVDCSEIKIGSVNIHDEYEIFLNTYPDFSIQKLYSNDRNSNKNNKREIYIGREDIPTYKSFKNNEESISAYFEKIDDEKKLYWIKIYQLHKIDKNQSLLYNYNKIIDKKIDWTDIKSSRMKLKKPRGLAPHITWPAIHSYYFGNVIPISHIYDSNKSKNCFYYIELAAMFINSNLYVVSYEEVFSSAINIK